MINPFLICLAFAASITAKPLVTEPVTSDAINDGAIIRFENPLPAMHVEGRSNGTYNNIELGLPGVLTTLDTNLGMMLK